MTTRPKHSSKCIILQDGDPLEHRDGRLFRVAALAPHNDFRHLGNSKGTVFDTIAIARNAINDDLRYMREHPEVWSEEYVDTWYEGLRIARVR